jgi:site-specific recombinase XerD
MTDKAISPLRQRMIEDMTIRKFSPKTQHDYVQRVKNFAAFLGRSPDTTSFEDVRRYQLHLATSGAGVPTLNQSVSTLRFFFRIALGRADIVNHTQFIHAQRKLPVVLSPEEVARFLGRLHGADIRKPSQKRPSDQCLERTNAGFTRLIRPKGWRRVPATTYRHMAAFCRTDAESWAPSEGRC